MASPTPDLTGVSQGQLNQELIPLLNQECTIVEARVQIKRDFFHGTQSFSDAFWEFSGTDLFRLDVLQEQKNTIQVQYQARLTQTFHNLVDDQIKPELLQNVSDLVEQKWNAENERDTLNLRMLHLLSQQLEQHAGFIQLLNTVESANRTILRQKSDPTEQNLELARIVAQQKYVRLLKNGLIQLWFHNDRETIEKTTQALLMDLDIQDWSLDRQEQTMLLFSPWHTGTMQQKITQSLEDIREKGLKKKKAELEQTWITIQEEWPKQVSKLEEEEAKIEQEKIQKKRSEMQDDILPLQKEIFVYQLGVLDDHIKQRSTLRNEAQLRESQIRLKQAKQKELEAKQSADQKRIQQEVVRLRELETRMRETELKRHEERQGHIDQAQKEALEIKSLFTKWKELPPLAPNRSELLGDHTLRVHTHKNLLQKHILDLETLPPIEEYTANETHPSVEQALFDIKHAAMDRSKNIVQEQQDLYTLWISISEHELRTKHHDVRVFDGEQVWDTVRFEGNHLSLAWNEHVFRVKGWFKDINHILDLVRVLLWGGFFLVCWQWVLRRVFPVWQWIQSWLRTQDRLSIGYETRDEHIRYDQRKLIHQVYYLISALFLHSVLYGNIFRVLSSVLVFIVGLQLVSILIETWKETGKNLRRLQRSVSIFVVVYFGWNILEECMQNLFFAYQAALVLQWIQNVILLLFFAVQLGTWSTFLDKKADDTVGLLTLKTIREALSKGILGSRLRAILSLLILFFDAMGRVIFWCIEHSSLFGSTLARNALEETATKHEGLVAFDAQEWHFDNTVLLEPYKEKIMHSIADWKHDQKRGSIVITADEGMGKSHLINLIKSEDYGIPVHSFFTGDIERNEHWNRLTVLRWIARALDAQPDEIHTSQDVIDILQKRDSTIFFLDNVHHVFIRLIEGFVVLDTLFTIIQETSNRHCWILTCHLPTWKFITSPATPIQSNFFRTEVHLAPWSVQNLQVNMKKYVEEKEFSLDFSSLTALKNPQSVHRAQMSYWRLLADASKGNPSIAFELFLLSLFQEEGKESKDLLIKLFPLLKTAEIQKLDDMSCFVLAAIVLHQEIRFSELCRSLQISSEIIQSICKNLVDMDVVVLRNQEYMVRSIWYPWVERVLLQKRFISMRL